jgi:integrase
VPKTGANDRPGQCVQPYSPDSILKRCIRPAATPAEITSTSDWHTFRRSFSTLLKANGEDVKVVQELLRHATVKMTVDVYAQAITPAKRNAQSKVIEMLRDGARMPKFLLDPSWPLKQFRQNHNLLK